MTARQPDGPAARRFARLDAALTALSELAAGPAAGRLPELLAGDDLALALMRAAADVVREAGMPVDLDAGHGDDDLLGRAAGWQAYAGGPVSELHGACGRAIARGLLRVWARRQGIRTGGAAARRAGLPAVMAYRTSAGQTCQSAPLSKSIRRSDCAVSRDRCRLNGLK